MKRRSTLKKHSKSLQRSEPSLKRTKARGPVQRDAKEVLAEVLGKLTGKLDARAVSTSAKENRKGNTVGPNRGRLTVGVDLGDRWSQYCILGLEGETLAEGQLRTTQEDVGEFFQALTVARVVIEVGTHSAWVQDVITEWGHEVLVANPRLMEGSKRRKRKSDRIDANKLARLGRVDPQSLYPIRHRSREVRQDLVVLRARDALVSVRTELINTTRGLVKSMGTRLPRCSSPSFAEKVKDAIPVEVGEALLPLVQLTETVNDCIARYDQKIEEPEEVWTHDIAATSEGGGPDHLCGLRINPGGSATIQQQSRGRALSGAGAEAGRLGDSQPQLGISKTGDRMLRRLLVGSSQYMLGAFGLDTHLRRYGLRLCERGGKNAKKRAVVAVARKLAVLLHHLWVTGDVYEPLHQTGAETRTAQATAA